MTKLFRLPLAKVVIALSVIPAAWVAVTDVGRLPQAAPSLSRFAPDLASRSGPNGLQSTIAGDAK